MGAFLGALVFSARIGRRIVAAHVLHYGYLLRRLVLLRLCCLSAHALAGLRSGGTAANGALLTLGRAGPLAFNARHALACLGAGTLTALAVGGSMSAVLNGANEVAVDAFLHERIPFGAKGVPDRCRFDACEACAGSRKGRLRLRAG